MCICAELARSKVKIILKEWVVASELVCEINFLTFFHSRPATSFLWFTSPFKTLRYIIWRRYKWLLLILLIIIILILFVVLFVYAMPVSSQVRLYINRAIRNLSYDDTSARQKASRIIVVFEYPSDHTVNRFFSWSISGRINKVRPLSNGVNISIQHPSTELN